MSKYAKNLIGSRVNTENGQVGKVKDILFSDENWNIKHLLIGKHKWLPFGKVLVEPNVIKCLDAQSKVVAEMRREDLKTRPPASEDLPVAEQKALEKQIERMGLNKTPAGQNTPNQGQQDVSKTKKDPHLRSMKEIIGYKIQATDGLIGTVNDVSFDLENWHIEGMVVTNGHESIRDNELIVTDLVGEFVWSQKSVTLNASKENVLSSLKRL